MLLGEAFYECPLWWKTDFDKGVKAFHWRKGNSFRVTRLDQLNMSMQKNEFHTWYKYKNSTKLNCKLLEKEISRKFCACWLG